MLNNIYFRFICSRPPEERGDVLNELITGTTGQDDGSEVHNMNSTVCLTSTRCSSSQCPASSESITPTDEYCFMWKAVWGELDGFTAKPGSDQKWRRFWLCFQICTMIWLFTLFSLNQILQRNTFLPVSWRSCAILFITDDFQGFLQHDYVEVGKCSTYSLNIQRCVHV